MEQRESRGREVKVGGGRVGRTKEHATTHLPPSRCERTATWLISVPLTVRAAVARTVDSNSSSRILIHHGRRRTLHDGSVASDVAVAAMSL